MLSDRDAVEEGDLLWVHALYKWQQMFEILHYSGALGAALLQEQVETTPGADGVISSLWIADLGEFMPARLPL